MKNLTQLDKDIIKSMINKAIENDISPEIVIRIIHMYTEMPETYRIKEAIKKDEGTRTSQGICGG